MKNKIRVGDIYKTMDRVHYIIKRIEGDVAYIDYIPEDADTHKHFMVFEISRDIDRGADVLVSRIE